MEILLGLVALVALSLWVYRRFRKKRTRPRLPKGKPHLQRELVRLLGGDEAAASRLVEREKVRNPGHGEDWYWDKVIYNLKRDRRS
ncbi:hypothetical protein PN462_22405 [Spirulina sp. CS-785/01]|uniref:hypothetical protein n=1 Tax=Spirulina sp. CS-785/01 TaxID=3021716 RepID=UPI00232E951D|nr:hypothetical protein [Spirulina sp. CS-785/01]MDB9315881.1 hypothetical protein [Spirulina sp. CS-785/01]